MEHFALKWNNHRPAFFQLLRMLREKGWQSDVTLACGSRQYKAHRLVLSSCSEFFAELFHQSEVSKIVVVLKDVLPQEMEALLDYMYLGEVEVPQAHLNTLLKAAEALQIKGLAVPDTTTTATTTTTTTTTTTATATATATPATAATVSGDDLSEAQRASRRGEKYMDVKSEGEYGGGCRRVVKRHFTDSDSDSGDSVSTEELGPKKKKNLPPPPDMSGIPPLQHANAIVERLTHVDVTAGSTLDTRQHLDDTSDLLEKSNDKATILCAVSHCKTAIEDLYKKVDQVHDVLSKKLDDILHKLNNTENQEALSITEDLSAIKPDLPVRTLEDFGQLDENLDSDPNLQEILHCRLRRLGGTSVKSSVKYMVDTVLTNEMQTKFNWEGRIGWKNKNNEHKIGFKKTKVCSIMTRALLNSTNFVTTEDEIGRTIMVYLRNSADRCGGRSRRQPEMQQSDKGS